MCQIDYMFFQLFNFFFKTFLFRQSQTKVYLKLQYNSLLFCSNTRLCPQIYIGIWINYRF